MNAAQSSTANNDTPSWGSLLHEPQIQRKMTVLLLSLAILIFVYRAHPVVIFATGSSIILTLVDIFIPSLRKFLQLAWSGSVVCSLLALVILITLMNNYDGQGYGDLREAFTGGNPLERFVDSIEEQCVQVMHSNKGVDQSPDRDKDHFTPDCGDTNDDDPSFTPRPLWINYDDSDFIPYSQRSVALAKGARFSTPAPALGQDTITDLYLYITADFLSSQDGQYQYYAQRCPGTEKYDPETWRLFCTLDEHIDDWREYVSVASDPKRQLKWRLKYVTQNHHIGFVQSDWIPFTADLP